MIRPLKLTALFISASAQHELAYRANFWISLLHSALNFGSGLLAVVVLFDQVETVRGWDFGSTLAVLGVYLTVSALHGLVISPSLETLAGIGGEIWRGEFDFTLLRPADTQFLVSLRHWRLFSLLDVLLGLIVIGVAVTQLTIPLTATRAATFLLTLIVSGLLLYAILLFFTSLVFWDPGFLFTWLFDGVFQMARYPVGVYPGALRLVLTWVIPVGILTTVPARALSGDLPPALLAGSLLFAAAAVIGASALFRTGLRRYSSASS